MHPIEVVTRIRFTSLARLPSDLRLGQLAWFFGSHSPSRMLKDDESDAVVLGRMPSSGATLSATNMNITGS